MVGLESVAALAARYETVVAIAFRRALAARGVRVARARRDGVSASDVTWCFRNDASPMDLLR